MKRFKKFETIKMSRPMVETIFRLITSFKKNITLALQIGIIIK